jgi:hypothetical protein
LVRPVSEGLFAGALDISTVPSFGDQAALFGLLDRIQALNLTLIAVTRLPERRPD